jgi:manganese transport protein
MAASVFYRNGLYGVAEIQDAHRLLAPLLGASIAPIAFAIALLASGQSSTITGTLAGQIVMEGYLNLRIPPWLRRLVTRTLAVVPAVIVILHFGDNSTGAMLVLSQVVLSLQLPFAIIPLIHAVADKRRMGKFAIRPWLQGLAWLVAIVILGLNVKLVIDQLTIWIQGAGAKAWILQVTVLPLVGALSLLLLYVTFQPLLRGRFAWQVQEGVHQEPKVGLAAIVQPKPYQRVAVALDFSGKEEKLLAESLRFVKKGKTELVLLHVVESPVAQRLGTQGEDLEMQVDEKRLQHLAGIMKKAGVRAEWRLGAGNPVSELARMVNELKADALVVGGHGHAGVSDLIHGTVISNLRHHIQASLLIVPMSG